MLIPLIILKISPVIVNANSRFIVRIIIIHIITNLFHETMAINDVSFAKTPGNSGVRCRAGIDAGSAFQVVLNEQTQAVAGIVH